MKNYPILLILISLLSISTIAVANTPKKGEMTMEKAQEIALNKIKGNIRSSEYEFEKGQNVYSFDIDGSDGKIHEILINAKSGKIVSNTIESAAKENKEAKEEAADQKK
jgi:competence protein ComGC